MIYKKKTIKKHYNNKCTRLRASTYRLGLNYIYTLNKNNFKQTPRCI